jgi:hypothetical protein
MIMINDPIVGAIRSNRQKIAERFNFDIHAICEDLRRKDAAAGARDQIPPDSSSKKSENDAIDDEEAK